MRSSTSSRQARRSPTCAVLVATGALPGRDERLVQLERWIAGIHIRAAVQRQKAASGDWMIYAADLTRRHPGSMTKTPS